MVRDKWHRTLVRAIADRCLTPKLPVESEFGRMYQLVSDTRLVAALLLVLAAPLAHAELQLRPGMTGVADLGAISCSTFNDIYPNGPTGLRQAALYYAEGYIYAKTGKSIDEALAGQEGAWDFDSLTNVIVDYCANNPEAQVSNAVEALFDSL